MEAAKARGGHLGSDAASEDFTYAEYWRALMAAAEPAGQTLHAEDSRGPVRAAKSPTPTQPPSRRAQPSHLTAPSVYRLHLALTPSPHKAERLPLRQPQQQEPPHLARMSRHVGKEGEWIERAMQASNEGCAPAGHSIPNPSSARKSLARAVHTGPWVSSSSTLDMADHLSDEGAGAVRSTDSKLTQRGRAAVIGVAPLAGSIFGCQRASPAPSDGQGLVDSPRQHDSVADNTSVHYPFSLPAAAAPLNYAYTYTPDALIVKAAQCYEQWRQCFMEGSADTDDGGYSAQERHSSDGGSSTAEDDQVRAAVRGISLTDSPACESAEMPLAAAPNEASGRLPPTLADDKSGLPGSHRDTSRSDVNSLCSPVRTRGKQTPSCTGGIHSRIHSLETTHGLTSGKRERVGYTGSTIKAPVELPSLSTRTRPSPGSKIPSQDVASTAPTTLRSVCGLNEKAAEPATIEIELEMSVGGRGARSQGTPLPPQQRLYQHSFTKVCHCLCQRTEMHAGVATSSDRSESTHQKHMREDVRIVDEAPGLLQSFTLAKTDVDDAHNAAPLSLVYRRLFTDESEDGDDGVAGTRHRESGGVSSSNEALTGQAPCFGKEGHDPSLSDALDVPSERQHGATRITISGAADKLTALTEVGYLPETLIELSSSCSSGEGYSGPVEGVDPIEGETASHFGAGGDEQAPTSPGAAHLDGNRNNLIGTSASHLPLQSSAGSIGTDQCDGEACAELTDGEVHTAPAATARLLPCSDHPLWRKHHALVSMQYASQLLPSERANDELLLFLCWAQEKADRQKRWRQNHHNGDDGWSETVFAASALRASRHVPCVASEVYKVAYAAARHSKRAGARISHAHQDNDENNKRDATVRASPAGFSSAQVTPPSCQRGLQVPHPAVFVASPLVSSEGAMSSQPSEDVEWTLTPSAAPSRFVEWIATEVDPYDSLLFAPL